MTDVVVLDAEDTDVVVLAAHVAQKVEGCLGIRRKGNIYDCKHLCTPDIADIIIQLHMHNWADTVSGFFGHGKTSVMQRIMMSKSNDYLTYLQDVGKHLPASQGVMYSMEQLTIKYVYGNKVSRNLSEARAVQWTKMKKKSTQRIPPDKDSHALHVQRVNYHAYIWLNFDKPDPPVSPLDHGWYIHYTRWYMPTSSVSSASITS